MCKALVLYVLALAALSMAVWHPTLAWLSPLAMLLLLVGAVWLWRREGRPVRDLGLHRTPFLGRAVGCGLAIGLGMPLALTVGLEIGDWLAVVPTTWTASLLAAITTGILAAVFKTALTVAVEEIAFRGCFLQRFEIDMGARRAVLLSSALFASLHVPAMLHSGLALLPTAIGFFSWLIFGTALSAGFLSHGRSLWFPWGLHYAYNLGYSLTTFVAAALRKAPVALAYVGPTLWVGVPEWAPESGLLGLLLQAAILAVVLLTVRTAPDGDKGQILA